MEGKPSKDSALKIIGERVKKVTVFVKMWITSETKFYLLVFVLLAVHFFFFCIMYISPIFRNSYFFQNLILLLI